MYWPIILGWVLYVFAGPELDNWIKENAHSWSTNIIIASGTAHWVVDKHEQFSSCFHPVGGPNGMVRSTRRQCVSFSIKTAAEFGAGLTVVGSMMGWWKDNDEKLYTGLQVSTPSKFKWVNGLDEDEGRAIATATFGDYKLSLTSDGIWNQTTVTKDSIAILGLYNNTATSKIPQVNSGTNGSAVYLVNYAPEVGLMMRPLVLSTIDKSLITAWTEDSMVLGWPEDGLNSAGKWQDYEGKGLL